jgi:hypothetical protein
MTTFITIESHALTTVAGGIAVPQQPGKPTTDPKWPIGPIGPGPINPQPDPRGTGPGLPWPFGKPPANSKPLI